MPYNMRSKLVVFDGVIKKIINVYKKTISSFIRKLIQTLLWNILYGLTGIIEVSSVLNGSLEYDVIEKGLIADNKKNKQHINQIFFNIISALNKFIDQNS